MATRAKARSLALQALYGLEHHSAEDLERSLRDFVEHFPPDDSIRGFFLDLVRGTRAHVTDIDVVLGRAATRWKVDRMPAVDRNLLRLATYELLHHRDIPAEVTISEAVDLAKRFEGGETPAFVNGVLDRVAHECGRLGREG